MPDYPQSPSTKSKKLYLRGLFFWSLMRELASTGLLVSSILLGIMVFTQLIRFLGEAVNGMLPVEGVLVVLGFSALSYLPVLLSVSLFLSVVLTVSRSYRDSEMAVWFSSGVGLTRWMIPVLGYALPIVAAIALLSLVLSPWALSRADEYRRRLDSRDDVAAATPGVFRESKQADRVFFLEEVDSEKRRVGNIFVRTVQNGREGIMVAQTGYQETAPNGDRFLILLNGMHYDGVPGQADFRIVEFERYAMRIDPAELREKQPDLRTYSTLHLVNHPTSWHWAELGWRIGLPISALILVLLAIPLSHVNPRTGRSLNLLIAITLYMLYNNLISVANSWVGRDKLDPVTGLFGIHLLMIAVTVVMFYHRTSVAAWWRWRR